MYSCDFIFQVWEYTYEDFSIFGFYQFSIVVLVTYFHTHTYWESSGDRRRRRTPRGTNRGCPTPRAAPPAPTTTTSRPRPGRRLLTPTSTRARTTTPGTTTRRSWASTSPGPPHPPSVHAFLLTRKQILASSALLTVLWKRLSITQHMPRGLPATHYLKNIIN